MVIIVGLTGGIGSGKSTVRKIFENLGVPVYDADYESKQLLNTDEELKKELIKAFGEKIYSNEGFINKKVFAAIIFNDEKELEKANSIIHPAVEKHFLNWVNSQEAKYVVKEAAILFESGSFKKTDKIITVSAPVELRIKRVCKRDNTNEEQVRQRIKNQMTDEERKSRSDWVIINDEKQLILPQILKIHDLLINCEI